MKASRDIELALTGRSVLILSDAYAPYISGGAEVSLEAVLINQPSDWRKKVVVATFTDKVSRPTLSHSDEMAVLHFPEPRHWPYNTLTRQTFERWERRFHVVGLDFERLLRIREVLTTNRGLRARKVMLHSLSNPSGGIVTDEFFDSRDIRVKWISAVCRKMAALDQLIADNTRSILIGAQLLKKFRAESSVAIVRDNRFHCVRPTQSRLVGGKLCKSCNFQCAREDASNAVGERVENLKYAHKVRSDSLNSYSKVVVTSFELQRHVSPILTPKQMVIRIPNTVGNYYNDVSKYLPAEDRKKRLLIIGMLNENKGQLEFLKAAEDWLQARRDVCIVLCGKGDRITRQILKFVSKAGLDQQVELLGFQPRQNIFEQIRRSSLVLAPTRWAEPFGRVPLEAGIAERAIVAFGVGGLNESIIHGYTGFLSRPGDYRQFLNHIEQLLEDDELRLKMEQNAKQWISRTYCREHVSGLFSEHVFSTRSGLT